MKLFQLKTRIAVLTSAIFTLAACGGSDHNDDAMTPTTPPPATPAKLSYEVHVYNLTKGQLFSPVSIILHDQGHLWELGQPASVAIEKVAEAGDNADLLSLDMALATAAGDGPILAGEDAVFSITIDEQADLKLSIASMLGNTNDAFTGLDAISLQNLQTGDSQVFYGRAYDAGTEANLEDAVTVPGPAAGGTGEGFNSERNDVRDMVLMHSGVVSADDGLETSALSQAQRFESTVAKFVISRTE